MRTLCPSLFYHHHCPHWRHAQLTSLATLKQKGKEFSCQVATLPGEQDFCCIKTLIWNFLIKFHGNQDRNHQKQQLISTRTPNAELFEGTFQHHEVCFLMFSSALLDGGKCILLQKHLKSFPTVYLQKWLHINWALMLATINCCWNIVGVWSAVHEQHLFS